MTDNNLDQELEELLNAELTEEELADMEKGIEALEEAEEVGGVAKMKAPSGKATPLKSGGGEKSELKDESDDLGGAGADTPEEESASAKAGDKIKKAKDVQSKGAKAEPKVSQGSSSTAAPGEKVKLAAGDEVDHNGEQLEEARMTKAKMLEDLAKKMESLSQMKSADLKGVYERIGEAIKTDAEIEEAKSDKELEELEAQKKDIEERIKQISVKEDVEALIEGEELSEEFKSKAAIIFEAAVKQKIKQEIERLDEEYAEKLTEEITKSTEEANEKVNDYLGYVVEEWMKQNEVAIEQKLKTEITENFITGLHALFTEHNITVPDEKYDILDAAAKQADEMEAKLNEQTENNIELTKRVGELEKNEILVDVASGLADTEVEKFVGLAENVDYENNDDYRKKLETIKESYFARSVKEDEIEAAPVYDEQGDVSRTMAAYMSAISSSEKRAQK